MESAGLGPELKFEVSGAHDLLLRLGAEKKSHTSGVVADLEMVFKRRHDG